MSDYNPNIEAIELEQQTVISEEDYLAIVNSWINGIELRRSRELEKKPVEFPPRDERYIDLR